MGTVHKIRAVEGEGSVQYGHFSDKEEGFFKCGRPHFLVQKTSDFLYLWCVRTDKGSCASADIWRTRGSIFRDFVRTSFMDGPLSWIFLLRFVTLSICKIICAGARAFKV